MEKEKRGCRPVFLQPLDYKLSKWYDGPKSSTPVNPQSTRSCDHCLRPAPRLVRCVEWLNGPCSDTCRACFLRLTARETRDAIARQFHNLFNWRPSLSLGRAVDYFLARAMFAAYRDKSHRLWIALARIVARIAERGTIWQ